MVGSFRFAWCCLVLISFPQYYYSTCETREPYRDSLECVSRVYVMCGVARSQCSTPCCLNLFLYLSYCCGCPALCAHSLANTPNSLLRSLTACMCSGTTHTRSEYHQMFIANLSLGNYSMQKLERTLAGVLSVDRFIYYI